MSPLDEDHQSTKRLNNLEEKENYCLEVEGECIQIKKSFVKISIKPDVIAVCRSMLPQMLESDRTVIFEDSSDLPEGWLRFREKRILSGRGSDVRFDRYVSNPEGKKFDRQSKLDDYLRSYHLNYDISIVKTKNKENTPLIENFLVKKKVTNSENYSLLNNKEMGKVISKAEALDDVADSKSEDKEASTKAEESATITEVLESSTIPKDDESSSKSEVEESSNKAEDEESSNKSDTSKEDNIINDKQTDDEKNCQSLKFHVEDEVITQTSDSLDKSDNFDLCKPEQPVSSNKDSSHDNSFLVSDSLTHEDIKDELLNDSITADVQNQSEIPDNSASNKDSKEPESDNSSSQKRKSNEDMRPKTKRHKPNIITVLTSDTEEINDVSGLEDLPDSQSCKESSAEVGQNEKMTNTNGELCKKSDLPEGWSRKHLTKAFSTIKIIVIVSPDGKQFDTQKKLNSFIARNKLNLKINLIGAIDNDKKDEEETDFKTETELKLESKLEQEPKLKTESKLEPETGKEELKSEKKKTKKTKTKTVVTDRNLTNDDIDNEDEKTFSPEELEYVTEMNQWLLETDLDLEARPTTKGDGNCWFRALSEQVNIHNLPNMPRNHRSLRLEVCDHVKNLPEKVLEDIIQVSFDGKRKKLTDLVCRQRFADQWIDDHGIMVLTTAAYLSRDIEIYSYPTTPSGKYGITKIPSSLEDDTLPPLTVFFSEKHYQTLQKRSPSSAVTSSVDNKEDPDDSDKSDDKCENL